MLLCYNFAPINIDFFLNGKVLKCYKKMEKVVYMAVFVSIKYPVLNENNILKICKLNALL